MADRFDSSQLEFSTAEVPITSTTSGPEPVNLPLAIALPVCLFVFLTFLVILVVCLVRKKKCSQKPVEPPMSRGSVEGSSDNGDNNNNNDGETDNQQEHEISIDGEILQADRKPDVDDVSPTEQRSTCAANPEESFCHQENQDETESTTRSIMDGEENPMPEVCEHETPSDVAMDTVAVASPVGQQSQMQDPAVEMAAEEQEKFPTYVIAVYSFEAEHENQMSLVEDDIVLVAETEEHEGWLCGWKKNSSETGWFPKSHVREVEQHSSGTIGSKLSDSTETDDDFDEDVKEYECRALYGFDGDEEGELSFEAGDSLVVLHGVAGTGWLYGQRGEKVGWFPESYVKVIPGSNQLTPASSDMDSTTTTHDLEEAPKTAEQKRVVIAITDIVPEGSHLSPSVNTPHNSSSSPKTAISKNVLKTNKKYSTPSSAKSKRSSIPSGKPNISDRLGLSKIINFRKRKNSTDQSVTLKEVVTVPSPESPGINSHKEASPVTPKKQIQSAGKKGKKELVRPVIPPPQAPRRQSLLNAHNQKKEKMELSSCNGNQSSHDQNVTLPDTNTGKPLKDTVTTTEEYDSSKPMGVVVEPTENKKRAKDVVYKVSDCVEVLVLKPVQSKADDIDTRRQWDITLENFDRILEGSNDFSEAEIPPKPTNLVLSRPIALSGSMTKTPDHRNCSTPQLVTKPDAVNGAGPFTLQFTPPQVNSRNTNEERSIDNALMHGDDVSQQSELGFLSFAPPGFNDSEEVLSPKFLTYLSQVGSIDKSRLSQAANAGLPLRRQSSVHPPLPPKPSWPPTSDNKDEEHHNKEGDVSKEDDSNGTLTFVNKRKGKSNRQSLSTLLLPDVVRGYITTDEYENFQIPPPAGFSSDTENVEENNRVVSLESLDSPSNFREIQTPRYFGRTLYGPQEDDSRDDFSSALPEVRQKVSERLEVPVEVPTDTVVWKPWGHLKPKITRRSYVEDVEDRPDSFRSRHDTSSNGGVMFKLADGSVVFDESDVGLESVI